MADEFKEPMNTGAREWDAETYDAVSDPQFEWGMEVLERLELRGDEVARRRRLRLRPGHRASWLERLPDGRVIAVDGSEAMVEKAQERLGDARRPTSSPTWSSWSCAEPVDLIFSTATFHWIPDHDALFARLRAALKPGGRLVAQCGGEGNVAEHAAGDRRRRRRPGVRASTSSGDQGALELRRRRRRPSRACARAGFAEARCWLQPKPVAARAPARVHLHGHPRPDPRPAAGGEAPPVRRSGPGAGAEQPLVLDYVRLNIEAASPPDDA